MILNTSKNKRANLTRQRNGIKREGAAGWMFVLPFLLLFTFVFIIPLVYSMYISFFGHQLIGGTVFVGAKKLSRTFERSTIVAGYCTRPHIYSNPSPSNVNNFHLSSACYRFETSIWYKLVQNLNIHSIRCSWCYLHINVGVHPWN